MKYILLTIAGLIFVYMTYKNIAIIQTSKKNQIYFNCYEAMLRRKKDAFQLINESIEKEKNIINLNRMYFLKMNMELQEHRDYKDTLEKINIKELIYYRGQLNQESISGYADSFLWMGCAIANAHYNGRPEAIEEILNIVGDDREVLHERFEYRFLEVMAQILAGKEYDREFISKLRNEEFKTTYKYDKRFASIFRNFGLIVLDKAGEELTEEEKEDVRTFAKTQIGDYLLRIAGRHEEYAPERKEETPDARLEALDDKRKKKKKKKEEKEKE